MLIDSSIGAYMKNLNPGSGRPAWLPWAIVTLLAGSCCLLAVLQYRWIIEVSAAERDRIRMDLQSRLGLLSRNFNDEISNACLALIPDPSQIEASGREKAYAARYQVWRGSHDEWFRRIALAVPSGGDVAFHDLDLQKMQFAKTAWPADWSMIHVRVKARMNGTRLPPPSVDAGVRASAIVVFPRFGESPDVQGLLEQEWLIVELNEDRIRETMLAALLKKYLSEPGGLNYDTEVTVNSDVSKVIFPSGLNQSIVSTADASVPLLTIQGRPPGPPRPPPDDRGRGRGFGRRGPPVDGFGFGPPPDGFGPPDGRGRGFERGFGPPPGRRGPPPPRRGPQLAGNSPPDGPPPDNPAQARWRLFVRHRAGSLEALAARARNRNLMISGGLLLLILAIVGWLLQLSRQSQRLAESHMNFVAGVSHELRTPLTVIRTAAYNLRGKLSNRPDQVEKYGKLIQDESEKLGALVEQVLQFASGEAGHVTRGREPVSMENLIEESLQWSNESLEVRGVQLEKHIEANLPPVLADRLAMKHALRNLLDNALKYGAESVGWIGVTARAIETSKGPAIEIRVADRGPGIPADEQARIFEPFFRGRRAISDQVHGTGLGLNLVRRIVEAHGGTIHVKSSAGAGSEFIVRLPSTAPVVQSSGETAETAT